MSEVRFYRGAERFLNNRMESHEFEFLLNALKSFLRLLPHTEMGGHWTKFIPEINESVSTAKFANVNGQQRRAINLKIYIPSAECFICGQLKRRIPGTGVANVSRVLDNNELSICKRIVELTTQILTDLSEIDPGLTSQFIINFDESVVLEHLRNTHKLNFDLKYLVDFLKQLSEQSYENKSLSFGILIDKKDSIDATLNDKFFPQDFVQEKKFRAFTDGYRSAYLIDSNSRIKALVDLESQAKSSYTGEHYYPQWSGKMALSSIKDVIGFSLTRQGDILFFENGSMRFTRRFGKWQYWNHAHIIEILRSKARAQHIQPNILGRVVLKLYKYALDISFRHTGALFVIPRNQSQIHQFVRPGDGISDRNRKEIYEQFERFLLDKTILGLDRNIIIELSSIDGAVVFSNNGYLLAYGAVLSPKKREGVQYEEGSRSKAAVGASHYGLTIKISADGGISIYQGGKKIIEI